MKISVLSGKWTIVSQLNQYKKCSICRFVTFKTKLTTFQPSPLRRDERPVSCYTPSNNSHHHHSSLGSAGRDTAGLMKDKQRTFMPSLVNNETYGTILSSGPQQPGSPAAPPLPPRNLGKQRKKGSGIKIMCPMILTCFVALGRLNLAEVFSKDSTFYRSVLCIQSCLIINLENSFVLN